MDIRGVLSGGGCGGLLAHVERWASAGSGQRCAVRALPRGDWPLLCIPVGGARWTPDAQGLQAAGLSGAKWDGKGLRLSLADETWLALLDWALGQSQGATSPSLSFTPDAAYAYARTQWLLRVAPDKGVIMPRDEAARKALWCALCVSEAQAGRCMRLRRAAESFLALTWRLERATRLRRLSELRGIALVCAAVFSREAQGEVV